MHDTDICKFLKNEIEPLDDDIYGKRYRIAARLRDGTYLPCVVVQSKSHLVDLALRRFAQEKMARNVVESFVAKGGCVNDYDLSAVECSPYAWPLATLRQIHGETTMGWTAFVVEMADGQKFSYGTSFLMEFFDLPVGYSYTDIKAIHSGVVYSEAEGMKPLRELDYSGISVYRERPFFTCYIDGLDV